MAETWRQWEGLVADGKFHLRQYLGGSDHSAVFLTELGEQGLQKAVIKLIPVDTANAELHFSRFKLGVRVSHRHLIQLFAVGRCRLGTTELLYVVMEYADEDLSQILPHRPLTPAEARDMLKPVLEALAYLHSHGFAHGRMKPANIMAIDDQIKVSSDGICLTGESSTRLGGPPGAYDPPEAASGRMSPAGDVWALGMTLAEALTQRIPVPEESGQGDPMLPQALPPPFLDLVRHCLRSDPQRRWTVADIASRLEPAPPIPPQQTIAKTKVPFTKWRYTIPAVAALALVIMLVSPRILNRRPKTHQTTSIAPKPPGVQPKPEQTLVKPETGPPSRGSGLEGRRSTGTVLSPAPLRSEARMKPSAGGLVAGEVRQQVLPDVPQSARDTIQGKVRVRVRVAVDPSGSVTGATLDSAGPSKYFANLALQAAQRWKFGPASVDGQPVSSEWTLRFEFGRTGTKVIPLPAAP